MLRIAILVLVLVNAAFYAWSSGALRNLGWGPVVQTEPQRLQQQIEPEKMKVTPLPAQPAVPVASAPAPAPAALTASAASTPASAPAQTGPTSTAPTPPTAPTVIPVVNTVTAPVRTVCLQASGAFDEHQAQAWRSAAQGVSLTEAHWKLEPATVAGRWMVYMGKFADDDALVKKRNELRSLQIDYDRPGPTFEPGLSLGRFSTEEAANRALGMFANKGVRTARVVLERKESTVYNLRLPAVDDATRTKLSNMKSALAGKTLQTCS